MKKLFLFLLIAAMLTTFACDGAGRERPFTAIMGSSSLGGSWYPFAARMAGVAMRHGNVIVTVQASGGGAENVRLMRQGQYDMGLCEPNVAIHAYWGTGPFERDGRYDHLRFLFNMYPLPITAIVHRDGPIRSMADFNPAISGRRFSFSPGSPGSGDEFAWLEIFEAGWGVTRDMVVWRPLSHNERVMAFKDRILDSVGFQTAQPSGAIIELSAQNPIRILPIDGDVRDRIMRELLWVDRYTLPGGMYNGQDTPVETIFIGGFVLANYYVPDDFVYSYMAAIFGPGLEDVQSVFPVAREFGLDQSMRGNPYGNPASITYHPGAIRFFRGVGLIP
ncbi:MAG: TAXI family TRAP transporter solute-binding subunit [Spirochaetaceae bacterium]|nr:TAXI family TRAP transporter solute-binding subunit [Spirochaetaceae bacterium]